MPNETTFAECHAADLVSGQDAVSNENLTGPDDVGCNSDTHAASGTSPPSHPDWIDRDQDAFIREITAKQAVPTDLRNNAKHIREHNERITREAVACAAHGLRVVPVHSGTYDEEPECTCMWSRRNLAKETGTDVVPCASPMKHPKATAWQKHATRDPALLLNQWGKAGPRRNLGIVFGGADNTFVLDADGPAGLASLADLQASGEAPPTVSQITGSGGEHRIYRHPAEWKIKNSVSTVAEKLDVRGENGFIVGPGSLHKSGNYYRWKAGHGIADIAIAEAPLALLERCFFATVGNMTAPNGKTRAEWMRENGIVETAASNDNKSNAPDPFATEGGKSPGGSRSYNEWLTLMGDAEGCKGFDTPIDSALLSWHQRHPGADDAAVSAMLAEVKARIEAAEVDPAKAPGRRPGYIEALAQRSDKQRDKARASKQSGHARPRPAVDTVSSRQWPCDIIEDGDWLWYPGKKDGKPIIDAAGEPVHFQVCQPFHIASKLCDEHGEGVGRLMVFRTPLGEREYEIDAGGLSGPGWNDTVAVLRRLDFKLFPGEAESRFKLLLGHLFTEEPDKLVVTYKAPGLTASGTFILPDGDIIAPGGASETSVRLAVGAGVTKHPPQGNLEGYQEAARAAFTETGPNWHMPLGVLVGLAGVVSGACGEMSRVLYITGPRNTGKTTLQGLQVAAWTKVSPADDGLMFPAALTENSIEAPAAKANHTTAAFDEAAQMPAEAVGKAIFKLAGGASKLRQTRTGGNRKGQSWASVFTLSGEKTLEQIAAEAARKDRGESAKVLGGVIRRAPTISTADAVPLARDVMVQIESASKNWGHFGPAFVREFIARGHTSEAGIVALKAEIDRLAVELSERDGNLRDPARLFAILKWVGRFCVETGLLGTWADTDRVVQAAWDSFAGSASAEGMDGEGSALENVRVAIATGLNKTLHPLVDRVDGQGQAILINSTPIGWYADGVAYVMKAHLADMVGDYPVKPVMKRMVALGYLMRDEKRETYVWRDIPGKGNLSNFRFDMRALGVGNRTREECVDDEIRAAAALAAATPVRTVSGGVVH